jgi:hypothetical protein
MLFFGYLGETNILNKNIYIFIGFIFFGFMFYKIWIIFANITKISRIIFYIMAFIWGWYGIAAIFNVIPKNIMYNILDIFSKNFFSIFILYLIYIKSIDNSY